MGRSGHPAKSLIVVGCHDCLRLSNTGRKRGSSFRLFLSPPTVRSPELLEASWQGRLGEAFLPGAQSKIERAYAAANGDRSAQEDFKEYLLHDLERNQDVWKVQTSSMTESSWNRKLQVTLWGNQTSPLDLSYLWYAEINAGISSEEGRSFHVAYFMPSGDSNFITSMMAPTATQGKTQEQKCVPWISGKDRRGHQGLCNVCVRAILGSVSALQGFV